MDDIHKEAESLYKDKIVKEPLDNIQDRTMLFMSFLPGVTAASDKRKILVRKNFDREVV